MEKRKAIPLLRSIAEIENLYPKDDLISSYADFLKVRDYLSYYQFNPKLFLSLLKLANDEWTSVKRRNRFSLLQAIKQYMDVAKDQPKKKDYYDAKIDSFNYVFSLETRQLLFGLYQKVFEQSKYISQRQLEKAQFICNNTLLHISLTETEEAWLCSNAGAHPLILNRVLRYPQPSPGISQWAEDNFTNDLFRSRRAELISWIIDVEPDFEIDKQTLRDDFEYLNKADMAAIERYDDEMMANEIIERDLFDFLPKVKNVSQEWWETRQEGDADLTVPELKLSRRFYPVPEIDTAKAYPVAIPNFELLRKIFKSSIETNWKLTMVWAIAYSRIDNESKTALLKKYFCKDTYHSLVKVGKKNKNAGLLKWLIAVAK